MKKGILEFTHFLEQYQINIEKPKQSAFTQYNVTSSEITNTIAKEIFKERIDFREMFVCLYLNKANKVLGYYVIGLGGVASASVDLKLIFSVALNSLASGIVLFHNHLSGNTQASPQDIFLTKQIKNVQNY